ncbi:MAG TPA: packaged DNA stabilization protein [Steroidobacter sp.]
MAGIASWSTIAKSPQRAAINFGGTLYSVAGDTFYRVSSNGTETSIATGLPSGSVDIAKNTSQIAVLIEPDLWVYESGSLTQVTDTDFTSRGAKKMAVLDNFGGFIEPGSGRFFICDLADFTVYDSLDFATAEALPDNLLSIESNQRQFVLFGEESIELWDNVGGSGFPFLRVSNGYVESGVVGKDATTVADNTVFWLDQYRIMRRLEGITPRRISHDGVEQQWQDYETVSDAKVWSYVYDGHTFIVVHFVTQGATWVYDINTGEWHERASYGYDHWRAAWVVNCYGKTLVGDTETGNIGEIDAGTHTEWGGILSREATSGVVYAENRWAFHDRLELDMDVGNAPVTGQGSDPQIMLEVSDNGGIDFRALPNKSLGSTGEFRKRVHWDGLGRSRERVYRFRVTDPVPFVIAAARLDVRV